MLAVLADTTVTGRDVAAVLASLGEPGRHFLCKARCERSERRRGVEASSGVRPGHPASLRPNPGKSPFVLELGVRRMRWTASGRAAVRHTDLEEGGCRLAVAVRIAFADVCGGVGARATK